MPENIEFDIKEYVYMRNRQICANRMLKLSLRGYDTDLDTRVDDLGKVYSSKPGELLEKKPFKKNDDTDGLIHMLQTAMFLAQIAHPKERLEDLIPRFRFNVIQHRQIVTEEESDISAERRNQYGRILKKIVSGDYPRYYESLDEELGYP